MQKEKPYIISHLVAAAENNVIGNGNQLPWNLPDDFKYFKNKTWGMVVIMGRKTYESLDKLLPGRTNIVVTSDKEWQRPNVITASDIKVAIQAAIETDCKEIFIIGGGEIFKQTIGVADKIYLTRVHAVVDGDVSYPVIENDKWQLISTVAHEADDKHAFSFSFETWERINN